jgi:methyl-accepting chemotaxis protein
MNSNVKALFSSLLGSLAAALPLLCVFLFVTLPSGPRNPGANITYFSISMSFLIVFTTLRSYHQKTRVMGLATTHHQQTAIHQISSAIVEISAMINSAGDIARRSSELSAKTALSARQGEKSVVKVLGAIEKITSTAGDTVNLLNVMKQNIRSMNAILSEISVKTNAINDAVFQTKFLSFNASVEANRLGEPGQDFAKVVHAIGKLSEQSSASSREIMAILEKSQLLIEQIIAKSDEQSLLVGFQNDEALAVGEACIKECSSLLAALGMQATQAHSMSLGILEAHKAQSIGAEEILKGVLYLDSTTRVDSPNEES